LDDVHRSFIKAAQGFKSQGCFQLVIQKLAFDPTLKNMEKVFSLGHEIRQQQHSVICHSKVHQT
jgi:hypothetical protein